MSGGHWDYLYRKLEERAEYAGAVWELLSEIEHELDDGICCNTCYECAKIRVTNALEAFFDTGANSTENAIRLLNSSVSECQECKDRDTRRAPSADNFSTFWGYRCKKDGVSTQTCFEQDMSGYLEVKVEAYPYEETELFAFFREHLEHGIELYRQDEEVNS